MKIVLAVHGFPPAELGGTEQSALGLARALAAAGHDPIVVAGSSEPAGGDDLRLEETHVEGLRVVRFHRPDLYFDHWQKSRSVRVSEAFRDLLRREQPDLVHVLHWLRLSRDLVLSAAREGVPAVVSLNDLWTSCPLTFRLDPKTRTVCHKPLAAVQCISCAGQVPPRTPWVPLEGALLEFAGREADLARELKLARRILVPSRSHAERLARFVDHIDADAVSVVAPRGLGALAMPARCPAAAPPLRLYAFGSLSALKGTDLLIEAAADARLAGAVEVQLAGREEQPGWLQNQLARFRAARVNYLGPYAAEDLFGGALARAALDSHLFVSASRAPESFALVLDEARALGLACVLPAQGAFLERASEGVGATFFEAGNLESLVQALARLVADPAEVKRLAATVPAPVPEQEVLAGHLAAYDESLAAGPPENLGVPPDEWYARRMALFAEAEWDRGLRQSDPGALG